MTQTETGYDVAHLDELEALPVDQEGLVWRPVRNRFGIESFGVNAYTAAEAGHRVVEEHTEQQNQHDELYYVARGHATFTLDGADVDAPEGTFVFVRPGTRRGAVAQEAGTTVLAMGGKRGEPFRVSGWEFTFAGFAYLRAGDAEKGRAAMEAGVERYHDAWQAQYNMACFESLTGNRDRALEHLRRAVELDPQAAEIAHTDSDFDPLRDDPDFLDAIGSTPSARPVGADGSADEARES